MTPEEKIAKLEYELECYKYTIAAITYINSSYIGTSSPKEWVDHYMKGIVKFIENDNWRDDQDLRRAILRKGPPLL